MLANCRARLKAQGTLNPVQKDVDDNDSSVLGTIQTTEVCGYSDTLALGDWQNKSFPITDLSLLPYIDNAIKCLLICILSRRAGSLVLCNVTARVFRVTVIDS